MSDVEVLKAIFDKYRYSYEGSSIEQILKETGWTADRFDRAWNDYNEELTSQMWEDYNRSLC